MREINAFEVWHETNRIGPAAINLWYAFMQIANRAGWKNPLTIALATLEARSELKRDAIYTARKKLKEAGLIDYQEQGSNRATLYTINPVSRCVSIYPTQNPTQNPTQTPNNPTPIRKPKHRQETKTKDTPPISPKGADNGFDAFWAAYPRKVGKAAALKAYNKLHPSNDLQALMLTAIREQMQSAQWRKDGGQFIPNPTTWLTQGRWDDELRRTTGNVFADLASSKGNRIADMVQAGAFDDNNDEDYIVNVKTGERHKKTSNIFANLVNSGIYNDDDEPASNTL